MTQGRQIHYHGLVQVAGWGESRQGKWVKFWFDPAFDGDPLEPFRGLDTPTFKETAHILHITVADGDILEQLPEQDSPDDGDKPSVEGGPELASRLDAKQAWKNQRLWEVLCDTDAKRKRYRQHVALQYPCYICGSMGEDRHPHHWRELKSGAGAGLKPPDSFCISLCMAHHTGVEGVHIYRGSSEQWLEKMRSQHKDRIQSGHPNFVAQTIMGKWNREAFKAKLGISTMRLITEKMVRDFEFEYEISIL